MYGKHAVLAAISNKNRHIEKIYCLEKTFLELKNQIQKDAKTAEHIIN